jgi:nucleotide-binding universal stress UspA family protein
METMLKKIVLVPTDFSEVCNNAIYQAAEAAKHLKYKVCLLHVIDSNTKSMLKKEGKDIGFIEEKLKEMAIQLENEKGILAEHIAKEGSIFTTISEVASDLGASLIFLGTHGKVGMQKLTGSFALKVVTSSPVPVIVVQKRPLKGGFNNMVLPVTSDAGPWEKTKWATYIAKQFNAKIHIFQLSSGEKIKDTVRMISGYFDENDVDYTVKIADKSGNFTNQVIDYATTSNSDLIMIMTNPDKSLTTFILGRYDEHLIFNTSQIPVLCINPREVNWKKIIAY